jgi:hypothetical protein
MITRLLSDWLVVLSLLFVALLLPTALGGPDSGQAAGQHAWHDHGSPLVVNADTTSSSDDATPARGGSIDAPPVQTHPTLKTAAVARVVSTTRSYHVWIARHDGHSSALFARPPTRLRQ